jgi:hypothetical protein
LRLTHAAEPLVGTDLVDLVGSYQWGSAGQSTSPGYLADGICPVREGLCGESAGHPPQRPTHSLAVFSRQAVSAPPSGPSKDTTRLDRCLAYRLSPHERQDPGSNIRDERPRLRGGTLAMPSWRGNAFGNMPSDSAWGREADHPANNPGVTGDWP